jgi:hypothetical protein
MPEFKTKEEYEAWKAARLKAAVTKVESEKQPPTSPAAPVNTETEPRQYKTKEFIGLAGAVLLIIGIFLPFIKLPIVGSINYFNNGKGDGSILAILAVGACLFIVINKLKWLWVIGSASAATLLFTFYNLYDKMTEISAQQEEIKQSLAGNPFAGMATPMLDAMHQSIQLDIGIPILIIGTLLLFVSAFLDTRKILLRRGA